MQIRDRKSFKKKKENGKPQPNKRSPLLLVLVGECLGTGQFRRV